MSENTGIDATVRAKEWPATLYKKGLEPSAPSEYDTDSDILESNGTKKKELEPIIQSQDTLSKRRKHYEFVLSLVIWEALILISVAIFTIWSIWSDQTSTWLHCPYDSQVCLCQNSLLITGFLTIICDFLAIYGLLKWKVICLNFGNVHRLISGLYYFIFTGFWIWKIAYESHNVYVHSNTKMNAQFLVFLICLNFWQMFLRVGIEIQVENMLDYPNDPNHNNQLF